MRGSQAIAFKYACRFGNCNNKKDKIIEWLIEKQMPIGDGVWKENLLFCISQGECQ